MDKTSPVDKGNAYVKSTLKGRRLYEKIGFQVSTNNHSKNWFLAPALMFILGGLACFYISRRWN